MVFALKILPSLVANNHDINFTLKTKVPVPRNGHALKVIFRFAQEWWGAAAPTPLPHTPMKVSLELTVTMVFGQCKIK